MKSRTARPVLFFTLAFLAAWIAVAESEDARRPGGRGTVRDESVNAFSHPFPDVSRDLDRQFFVGNSFFKQSWVEAPSSTEGRDGLGPTYNAVSCSSCHGLDGRGPGYSADGQVDVSLLFRLSETSADGSHIPHRGYGDQFNPQAIDGVPAEGKVAVTFDSVPGAYADGTGYELRFPRFQFTDLAFGSLDFPAARVSPRQAPQLAGVGLLEAVAEAEILSREDPKDADGDGISGRANRVVDLSTGREAIGRFGWKAGQPTLRQQNAAAFLGDLGITTTIFRQQNCPPDQTACRAAVGGGEPEADEKVLDRVTTYTQLLAVPERRNFDAASVKMGEELFHKARCQACHVPSLVTGDHALPELAHQRIFPYTDLLLHDLGPALADHRHEGKAGGREWKTPPLWGLGLVRTVNKHQNLLHDGRARGIAEAILWHGGEAEAAKEAFRKMTQPERGALVDFVNSL